MSDSPVKRLATGQYVRYVKTDQGTEMRPVSKDEQVKLTAQRDNHNDVRKNLAKGVTVGTGIAVADMAAGALVTTEVIAAVPTILTVAALGAAGWGLYKLFGGK